MKDKELKLEDVKTPHTLGWVSYILLVNFVDIDSTEEVVSLFELDLQKPRNLSTHEREEREHGEGRDVYATVLQSDIQYSHMVATKNRHEVWGGWEEKKTKGPECTWEDGCLEIENLSKSIQSARRREWHSMGQWA